MIRVKVIAKSELVENRERKSALYRCEDKLMSRAVIAMTFSNFPQTKFVQADHLDLATRKTYVNKIQLYLSK